MLLVFREELLSRLHSVAFSQGYQLLKHSKYPFPFSDQQTQIFYNIPTFHTRLLSDIVTINSHTTNNSEIRLKSWTSRPPCMTNLSPHNSTQLNREFHTYMYFFSHHIPTKIYTWAFLFTDPHNNLLVNQMKIHKLTLKKKGHLDYGCHTALRKCNCNSEADKSLLPRKTGFDITGWCKYIQKHAYYPHNRPEKSDENWITSPFVTLMPKYISPKEPLPIFRTKRYFPPTINSCFVKLEAAILKFESLKFR